MILIPGSSEIFFFEIIANGQSEKSLKGALCFRPPVKYPIMHLSVKNFLFEEHKYKLYLDENNNKYIAHNVQGLDIRSSEDYSVQN